MALFDKHGLLTPGTHDMSLEDVREQFGSFQRTDCRPRLFARLRNFIEQVSAVSQEIRVIIDGSFIMRDVEEPGDIDVLLILPVSWDFSDNLAPFKYNIVSKRMVRRLFGFDMLVAQAGTDVETDALAFFSQVNTKWQDRLRIPAGVVKGLVRIKP